MKKILALGLLLFLWSCDSNPKDNVEDRTIRRIDWYQLKDVTLISKVEEVNSWGYSKRWAYVKGVDDDKIYYIGNIPKEIYDNYFKEAQKGDTICF